MVATREQGHGTVSLMVVSVLPLVGSALLVAWFAFDPSQEQILLLFMAAVFAGMAFVMFSEGRSHFRAGRHKPPLWLRPRGGDDWTRGLLRSRPNLNALLQILSYPLACGCAAFYFGWSLWLVAVVAAVAVMLIRPVRKTLRWMRSGAGGRSHRSPARVPR